MPPRLADLRARKLLASVLWVSISGHRRCDGVVTGIACHPPWHLVQALEGERSLGLSSDQHTLSLLGRGV